MNTVRWPALALFMAAGCSGGSEPPGAFKDEKFALSLVAPEGWTRVVPGNALGFVSQYEDRLLSATAQGLVNPVQGRTRLVVAFVKTDAPEALLPVIGILHNPVGLPEVGETEKEKSRAMLRNKMAGWEKAEEESADIVEVDARKAVRIRYSGSVVQQISPNKPTQRFDVRYVDHMIPSKSLTHFVSLTADAQAFEGHAKSLEQLLASFRSSGAR